MAYGYNQFTENLLNSLCGSTYGSKREIVSVNGLQEAKNFILNRGENIILRDSNEDRIYVKACDELGKYSLKIYQCSVITEKVISDNTPTAVSRSDLDSLKAEIANLTQIVKGVVNEHNAKQYSKRNDNIKSVQSV